LKYSYGYTETEDKTTGTFTIKETLALTVYTRLILLVEKKR